MIIKKPYAFLIKNFRLIHGLIFVMLMYLLFKTINIYSFFNQYVIEHAFQLQSNLTANYVGPLLYITAIGIMIVSLVVFYILSIKGKGNKFYLVLFIYYAIFLIFLFYMNGIFNNLSADKILNIESRRAVRDICMIVLLPQIVFAFIIIGRTLGFNLKQFEFKKDLEEMNIDISDSEEVEVTLGSDTYKIARFFRKLLRLSKYFVLENKIFVIGCASVLVTVLFLSIYSKIDVYSVNYAENQDLVASALTYKVEESFVTNTDINNEIINPLKKYVLVKLSISNRQSRTYSISNENFKLLVNDKNIIPIQGLSEKFADIGETFIPMEIMPGKEKKVLIVYEIEATNNATEFMFKIKNSSMEVKNEYKDIVIKPKNLNDNLASHEYKVDQEIDFSDSLLKDSTIFIGGFEIANNFKEKYTYIINNKSHDEYFYVAPPSTLVGSKTILKIESTLKMTSEDIYMKKHLKTSADLFDYYGLIKYRYLGEYKTVKLQKLDVDVNKNIYAYMLVPIEVQKANKIDLIIMIRGIKYTLNLK